MGDFTTHLKSSAWTGAEVGAVIVGGIAATELLDHRKIFKEAFAKNPGWFVDGAEGADFMIRHWGGIKFAGAALASTYVSNPWLKLALMGVMVQGGLQELRVLTWDKNKHSHRFQQLGAGEAAEVDAELKKLAEKYRTQGPDNESSVAGDNESSVARSYDDDFEGGMKGHPFSLSSSDESAAE